ncbi:CsbD family protein [Mycolicibacterium sp. S2-37]|uniref:CsbD family protein n=1 Tax=Mycolicibacterium sp. S2-37 TaxID=2810297 RepID=UPI001A93ECA2|nr:CsbD family protein [Mycolicibacterium sp. S2-37]MBO0679503.1 CsbD family protein [Mycolicibacterium sp. S2-37]
MSGTDKAKNKIDQLSGKGKEILGRVTGDRRLEDQGRNKQSMSHLKGAGEKIKDAFRR